MPELRTDWLTGRTVLVAENRANRPNEFADELRSSNGEPASAAGAIASTVSDCPFCAGNESRTPPAVYTANDPSGRWRLRVVPNMYPAVGSEADQPTVHPLAEPAVGAHEVIIEAARHIDRMSLLSVTELQDVFVAYAERLRHWRSDGRFNYGLIFKNQGARAGASLAHVHSQLMALPGIPPAVERELQRAEQDFAEQGSCAYCRLIARELSDGRRIVVDRDGYVAFCPFASLQPCEVWLLPKAHEEAFEQMRSREFFQRLAGVLHAVIRKLESLVPGAAYNMLLRTAPWQSADGSGWHWRIELLPRLTSFAGLELATGVHINPLPPESAAGRLRDA
jgi:UDPglucose--hexose-1-phosphate uridylyltransferase